DVLGAALREGWATLAARERVVLALRVLRSVRQSDLAVMLGIGAPRAGRLVAGSLDKLHAAVASRLDAVVGAAGRRRIWEELARTDAEPEGSRTAERGHVAELLARTAAATVGPSAAACPEAEQLAGFAEGQLTATEGGLVERHLADCADCLDLVAALGRTRAPHANEPSSGSEVRAVPVLRYVLLGIALAAAIVAVALFVRPAMLFETPAAIAAWKLVAVPASSDSDRELSLEVELRSPAFVSVLLMFRDEHDLRVQYRSWQLAADPAAQVLPRTGEASWPFVPRAAFAVYVVTSTRPVDLTSIVESVREAAGDQALTIYECDAVKAVLAERFDYVDARFVVPG
ncbi:MAG: hypothetical protein KDE27_01325, partial [Planctomycetes bacterium]|nr:hypothetical protein [Planctomycetota bacterium]